MVSPPTEYVLPRIITPLIDVAFLEINTAGAARKNVASTTSSDGSVTLSELHDDDDDNDNDNDNDRL